MILVDTPVWIDHFRSGVPELASRLAQDEVVAHPFVIGELSLGGLPGGEQTRMKHLMSVISASHAEVMRLIEEAGLSGAGIGYVDAHLIAAALLSDGVRLWTRDRPLQRVAKRLAIDAGLN